MSRSNGTTCQHLREDGTRCATTIALSPDGLCIRHDPARSEKAAEICRSGMLAQGAVLRARRAAEATRTVGEHETPAPLADLAGCVRWSSWVATAAATGAIDAKTADVLTRTIREFRSSYERAHMAEELARLRAEVKRMKAERSR